MRAVVLAAAADRALAPLTDGAPIAMVPVLDRPAMDHVVAWLRRAGARDVFAVIDPSSDAVRAHFQRALGYATGVRGLRERLGEAPFVLVAGAALTDLDVGRLEERHQALGALATVCVQRVADPRGRLLVLDDGTGRVAGLQDAPEPAEALSDLAACAVCMVDPGVLDFLGDDEPDDWARDVLPRLLEHDVPVGLHVLEDEGFAELRTVEGLRAATFALVEGRFGLPVAGDRLDAGLVVGEGSSLDGVALIEPPVWIGADVQIGLNTRLQGPLVVGDGATIGDGARLGDTIVLPGSTVARETVLVGGVFGQSEE